MSLSRFSLTDKVALITGGNGGIGRGIALGLQAAGAAVAVTGRNAEKNAAVAVALGENALVLPLDVGDEAAVQTAIGAVVARFGRLDILVNNAGIARGGRAAETARADWDAVVDANLTGSYLCAKHAAAAMIAQGTGGKIITIGSMYSYIGAATGVAYCATKAGVLGLTRALAVELAAHNIQVNAILPGWYKTEMTERTDTERIRRLTPANRWGEMDDLVGVSIFLASAASDFVTGADIPVDGGYLISKGFFTE